MKYKKLNPKEEGYLLLESLLTMIILITITMVLCPLIISWLSQHREAKTLVEESRQLYESSFILIDTQPTRLEDGAYTIQIDKQHMQLSETETEVIIYESAFKK